VQQGKRDLFLLFILSQLPTQLTSNPKGEERANDKEIIYPSISSGAGAGPPPSLSFLTA
jgi:hypothetical protein